jgi:hypothetical protein
MLGASGHGHSFQDDIYSVQWTWSYFQGFGKPFPVRNGTFCQGSWWCKPLKTRPLHTLGGISFGDVILKRTPVTSGNAGDMSLERRAVPFWRSEAACSGNRPYRKMPLYVGFVPRTNIKPEETSGLWRDRSRRGMEA